MSLVTGLFFMVILLNQRWSPPLRLQASYCSTFRIMCDVPSIAVFCSEFIIIIIIVIIIIILIIPQCIITQAHKSIIVDFCYLLYLHRRCSKIAQRVIRPGQRRLCWWGQDHLEKTLAAKITGISISYPFVGLFFWRKRYRITATD